MLINGILIHTKKDEVDASKGTVIITHGIAEHSGRYDVITSKLNEAGYSVLRHDLRGHGLSQGKRGKLKSYRQFVDDLHALVEHERRSGTNKVYLLGHSMGGLIVNVYATIYHDVDGIISSAAPTQYLKDVLPLRFIGHKWIGFIPKKSNFADDQLSRIKAVEDAYIHDPLNLKYFYISLIGEMFVKGIRHLQKNIKSYQAPVLIMHGEADKIVPLSHAQKLFEMIPHTDKQLMTYPEGYHEIFNDLDQEKAFKDVIAWLNEQKKAE